MNVFIWGCLGAVVGILTLLFIQFKSIKSDIGHSTRTEEKKILKKLKKQNRLDAELAKKHRTVAKNTSSTKSDTQASHSTRKASMSDLFNKVD